MEEKIRILLIEDNPADSRLINIYLKTSFGISFELNVKDTLEKGMKFLQENTVDIIISDLSLPDSKGLDTFMSIHKEFSDTPIIVLTGVEDESTGLKAMKIGAQDFLIKGKLHSFELKRAINYGIERHKLLIKLSENSKKLKEKSEDLIRHQIKLEEAQKLAHIGSWEYNVQTSETNWSDELYRIFGLNPQEIKIPYDSFLKMVHVDDLELVKKTIDSAYETLNTFDFNYRIVRPDGNVRMLHAKSEIIRDDKGNPLFFLGTNQDITEQFHEEEMGKLALAATQSYNSVIISDKNGKIEWVNDGFTKLSGYSLSEVKNTYGEVLIKGETKEVNKQQSVFKQVLIDKKPVTYERKNYTKQGTEYWVITTATPVIDKNGEVERIITIDSDISIRKKIENELQLANKIAEHSLMKGNKALNELMEAKKQLEESLKIKEQFLANMSHEIRTPMNAIIGFTNLVLKSELTEENKKFLSAIKTSGENLLVIINDILDFSKIESGKIVFEKINFNLDQAVSTLIQLMKPKADEKNIMLHSSVSKDLPVALIGDPTRLNQILTNLLSNAIKFTNRGEVSLEVKMLKEDNDTAEIEFLVRDTGIGIPPENLSKIFLSFTQGSNDTSRKYGGTGLGLTISKQLVESQGGKISVSSVLKEGSCFSFSLNFIKCKSINTDEIGIKKVSTEADLPEGTKVLLVEDNMLNQILAKKVLSNWKCTIQVAENGLIAIEKIKETNFDVVLMDIQMPEMNGYEATEFIRKKLPPEKCNVPIIAMTAHAFTSEIEKCKALGMNDYISKPFNETELYLKVSNAIKNTIK